jgi:hypothetical protein
VTLHDTDGARRGGDSRVAADSTVDEQSSFTKRTPRLGQLVLESFAHVVHRAHRAIEKSGRMQAGNSTGLVGLRGVDDIERGDIGPGRGFTHHRQVAQRQKEFPLNARRQVTPGDHATVHTHANGSGSRTVHDRDSLMMPHDLYSLRTVEECPEPRCRLSVRRGNPDCAQSAAFDELGGAKNRRISR